MARSLGGLRHAIRIAVAVILGVCASAQGADDFNDQRLEEGRIAYQRRNFIEAIDQFRVAAFGSLDRPDRLSDCLARLALAQVAAGQSAETDETLGRFVEVERRFGAYGKTTLEPDIRADFQALLIRSVPAATLSAVPSLTNLVETDEQKVARLPAPERRKALRAWAKREPSAARWQIGLARDAIERGDEGEARRLISKALSLDPGNAEALALQARLAHPAQPQTQAASARALSPTPPDKPTAGSESPGSPRNPAAGKGAGPGADATNSRRVLEESRRLVSASKAGDAVPLLTDAIKADPGNRELRLALLEAACLSRSYGLAVAQLTVSAPFSESEAPSSFYAAVALYETGRGTDARDFLQKALPRVGGPLVDEYSKKILGTAR